MVSVVSLLFSQDMWPGRSKSKLHGRQGAQIHGEMAVNTRVTTRQSWWKKGSLRGSGRTTFDIYMTFTWPFTLLRNPQNDWCCLFSPKMFALKVCTVSGNRQIQMVVRLSQRCRNMQCDTHRQAYAYTFQIFPMYILRTAASQHETGANDMTSCYHLVKRYITMENHHL